MKSPLFNLNWKDLLKGLIVAVFTAFLTGALSIFQTGNIEWTWLFWQPTIYASITAGIAYLLKNWLTNSEDKFIKKDQ